MMHRSGNLDALGVKFGTDKSSLHHDYLSFYERFFEEFRNEKIKVLEIGVFGGASLEVWEAYFPNAVIIGADIDPGVPRFPGSRVIVEILDQSNVEELVNLGVKHGPFDIIIEDGSHQWEHQITSLRTLFPFLRPGGFYVVEDLQTNYGAQETNYRGVSSLSCMDYLKKLVDLRVADDQIDITKVEDPFLRTYGRAVQFVGFHRRACLIEKARVMHTRRQASEESLVPADRDERSLPLSLYAHVGGIGNWWSSSGCVRGLRGKREHPGIFHSLRERGDGRREVSGSPRQRRMDGVGWAGHVRGDTRQFRGSHRVFRAP